MPRPIAAALLVRSGRFINKAADPLRVISESRGDRIYRFHNTDRTASLTIQISTLTDVVLPARSSIDLLVLDGHEVSVGKGRGVYDLLKSSVAVRSGSFDAAGVIARLGNKPILYRVINSSDMNLLSVTVDGGSAVEVGKESSMDLPFEGVVNVSGTDPRGIYDLLADEK